MHKRCFWGLGIISIQNRSTISGIVPLCKQLILWRFLVFLIIRFHSFEYRQKVKTDAVYQIQLFH